MSLLPELSQTEGIRFEYEMNMLLLAHRLDIPFLTVPINTVYSDSNRSTHFRPVLDSVRIYWDIIKFSCSSAVCGLLDFGLFYLLTALALGGDYAGITAAAALARVASGALNFFLNKHVVFGGGGRGSHFRYLALFLIQMLLSSQLTALLANGGIPASAAKLAVDITLFIISFTVQRKFIFKKEAAHDNAGI
jgi:putative flippase GtrA